LFDTKKIYIIYKSMFFFLFILFFFIFYIFNVVYRDYIKEYIFVKEINFFFYYLIILLLFI
jgi:hypothetical protein